MVQPNLRGPMTFWEFAHRHPIIALLIAMVVCGSLVDVVHELFR